MTMNKLSMKSVDGTERNIESIAELFPNVITEARDEHGKVKRAVDFDLLKQELTDILVEGDKERYHLTWPGKKEAIVNANTPIDKTLRPIKEDSVDWDNTQNLYIEGDNLEVLKLLQESYLNKVKCIYIDPPYNTGRDFLYKDNFSESVNGYYEASGQVDEEGNRLYQNTESNGRFHSDWLTMMYSRLKVARNLLSDDGVVFISIDDNEVDNLRKVCDEIYGVDNFIAETIRVSNSAKNNSRQFSITHDYCLIYAKNKILLNEWKVPRNGYEEFIKRAKSLVRKGLGLEDIKRELRELTKYPRFYDFDHYTYCDQKGVFRANDLTAPSSKNYFDILHPVTQKPCKKGRRGWAYSRESINELIKEDKILFGENEQSVPQLKCYLEDTILQTPRGIMFYDSQIDTKWLKTNALNFDYAKPVEYIKQLIRVLDDKNSIILDFFSGSSTTAHAAMKLNAEDDGNRKYIMVQLPEETDEQSEAYKAGYKNICEIGKERIRQATKKIKEETNADIDYGFRVFRLDSSNMKDVYYTPDKLGQADMDDLTSNIKEDRTSEDLLVQVMLECGLELSLPMETKQIEGKTVIYVAGNSLITCFDEDISESIIEEIAKDQPLRVVFRDNSFKDDSARINVEERFKMLSPNTEIQVL
jgi:adenine-specific DNA-methyltransferase